MNTSLSSHLSFWLARKPSTSFQLSSIIEPQNPPNLPLHYLSNQSYQIYESTTYADRTDKIRSSYRTLVALLPKFVFGLPLASNRHKCSHFLLEISLPLFKAWYTNDHDAYCTERKSSPFNLTEIPFLTGPTDLPSYASCISLRQSHRHVLKFATPLFFHVLRRIG